jgi:hypothetical protein
VLERANNRINELSKRAASLTDKEREELNTLLDRAAKLRDLLYPVPSRVRDNEFQDLTYVPDNVSDSLSTDDWVVQQVIVAEKDDNSKGFLPVDPNKTPRTDAYLVVVRKLKPDQKERPR